MAVYCSKCGHRQDRPMPFCPSCGTKMSSPDTLGAFPTSRDILPANVGPNAAAPRYQEPRASSVGAFVWSSLLVLVLAGFVFVRFAQAPTCAQAEQAIQQHHSFIFGAMNLVGMEVTASCSGVGVNPITAARYASVGWSYEGKRYVAAYWVDPHGGVAAANLTAGELDRAASSGVNALLSLLR